MKTLNIDSRIHRMMLEPFKSEVPSRKQVDVIIAEETAIYAQEKPIAIYKKATFDTNEVRMACIRMKFPDYIRQSGLQTQTININASPRNGRRTNMCMKTKFHREEPNQHKVFLAIARSVAAEYRVYFPKAYAAQVKRSHVGAKKVDEAYRIKGTPFTSGVINKNSALGFHRDNANTEDGISCMLILKNGVAGGELILPELNLGFACQDDYLLLFDGQKYIHGVTPILKPAGIDGYRYTIVYYNNKGMSLCLPPDQELEHYRRHLENTTAMNYLNNKRHEGQ